MKQTTVTLAAILVILGISVGALAQDEATEPRSPADMTVEERMDMMKAASKYDNCVYSQAISRIGEFPDIRQAADFALGECQNKLAILETTITKMGFGPDYANAFSKRIRNRAARKILPELAVRKAGGS
jgi:hypothetical protein